MKKQPIAKKRLKLTAETLVQLSKPELQRVLGGSYDSCFPDICQEKDSSGC